MKKDVFSAKTRRFSENAFLPMKRALQHFQSRRIRATYSDFMAQEEFQALGEFFFRQIYAPQDFQLRNIGIKTLHRLLRPVLPEQVVTAVAHVIELHDLSEELDNRMTAHLLRLLGSPPITWQAYARAYRESATFDQRQTQIELLIQATGEIHRISQWRTVGWILKTVSSAARLTGFSPVMDFLQQGYRAFHRVKNIDRFLQAVRVREEALNAYLFQRMAYCQLPAELQKVVPDLWPKNALP